MRSLTFLCITQLIYHEKTWTHFRLKVIRCRCSLFTIGISIAIRAKIKRNDRSELIHDAVARKKKKKPHLESVEFVKWTKIERNGNGKWEMKTKWYELRIENRIKNYTTCSHEYKLVILLQIFLFVLLYSRAHRNVLFRFFRQPNTGMVLLLFSCNSIAQTVTDFIWIIIWKSEA